LELHVKLKLILSAVSIVIGGLLVGYLVFISNDLLQIGAATVVDPTPDQDRATFIAMAAMLLGGSLMALGLLCFIAAALLRRHTVMTLIRASVVGLMSLGVLCVLEALLRSTPAFAPIMVLTASLMGGGLTFGAWAALAKIRTRKPVDWSSQ
jgi:hypothetical protein